MLITIIITSIIVGVMGVLLGIRVLFVKGGKFPATHIEENEALRRKGISCAKAEDRKQQEQQNLYELIKDNN